MVKLAEGSADGRKQDALYVRVGGDGRAIRPRAICTADIERERERLGDYRSLVDGITGKAEDSYRQEKAVRCIRKVFAERVA